MKNDLISRSELIKNIEFAIKASDADGNYTTGLRNGMRWCLSLLDGKEPIFEDCNSNDGWIPCSERLPEEHDSIFAKFKGTKKWNESMFEKISNEVNVTVADENGNGTTTHAHTVDGKWRCDLLKCNKTYRIIAWKELPEPYTKGN